MARRGQTQVDIMELLQREQRPMDNHEIHARIVRMRRMRDKLEPSLDTVRHAIASLAVDGALTGTREKAGYGARKMWGLATGAVREDDDEPPLGRKPANEPPPFVAPCDLAGLVQQLAKCTP